MQGATLTVLAIFSLLVLTLRPAYALAAYITALLWYPPYLVVSIGTIDISVGRFVVMVLLLRCLFSDEIRSKFTWSRLDTMVTVSMAIYVVMYSMMVPLSSALENRSGFLTDTWCAYLAARFIITDRSKLVSVVKCVSIILVPLAALGVIESVTGWQPFAPLRVYSIWYTGGNIVKEGRFGFARAIGPFSHAILFGGGFAMFLPLIYYLRHEKSHWRPWAYVLSATALLGALSSMSSGPWVMTMVVVFCIVMEKHKRWVKRILIFSVFSCILIGIVSNRPFYHVMSSWANPLGGAGWHRAKLIDLAIEYFDEWYVAGYGEEDPGWGEFLGMTRTDVTNEFILAGVKYGILGIIALCLVLITAFRHVLQVYKNATDPEVRSLCWAFGNLLLATTITWMSVSFFGQLLSLFYCVLGMIGAFCSSSFKWDVQSEFLQVPSYTSWSVS